MKCEQIIHPVLLSGGSGTRLWPLSRKSYPKQFARFSSDVSLFQSTAQRLSGEIFASPLIVTNSDFRFVVAEQLQEVSIDPGAILLEPFGRNTAPAILAAALWLRRTDPNALMLVAPSDHVIPNAEAFRAAITLGLDAAKSGKIVTFGVEPTHVETGYGYLELASPLSNGDLSVYDLLHFIEKPERECAEELVATGRHLWNSGVFLFSVAAIVSVFEKYAPEFLPLVSDSIDFGKNDLGFFRIDPVAWEAVPEISIDYAVMEQADNLVVIPFRAGWSDLGDWDAVRRQDARKSDGVSLVGHATAIDCKDTLLRSEAEGLEIVGLGLKNIVAVAMPDAVLVADLSRSQDVKSAVSELKRNGIQQAESSSIDHRPWGWFESLILSDRFQVKRIVVKAGGSLSLQSHSYRSEHWIVVEGSARVTIGREARVVAANQSVYIPCGEKHRLENQDEQQLVLIEVQTGTYFGEDDIVRYDDIYYRE